MLLRIIAVCILAISIQFNLSNGDSNEIDEEGLTRICPENNNENGSMNHRFFNKTGSCHRIGDGSVCGENEKLMTFHAVESTVYGVCDCDDDIHCGNNVLVYCAERDRCYVVHSRGPCRQHEWIVLDKSNKDQPTCQARPTHCEEDAQLRSGSAYWNIATNGECNVLRCNYFGGGGGSFGASASDVTLPCGGNGAADTSGNCRGPAARIVPDDYD